jgi:fimbrial chaperone protein
VTLAAKNNGNRHQVVQGIILTGVDASGQPVYSMTLADRYLLAGTARSYASTIAAEQCARIASLEVEYKTDKAVTKRRMAVTRAMCRPQ